MGEGLVYRRTISTKDHLLRALTMALVFHLISAIPKSSVVQKGQEKSKALVCFGTSMILLRSRVSKPWFIFRTFPIGRHPSHSCGDKMTRSSSLGKKNFQSHGVRIGRPIGEDHLSYLSHGFQNCSRMGSCSILFVGQPGRLFSLTG